MLTRCKKQLVGVEYIWQMHSAHKTDVDGGIHEAVQACFCTDHHDNEEEHT